MMVNDKQFKISGTGCALVDYLYKPVDFNEAEFIKFVSANKGDGGLEPGKLVFKEEFEKFSGINYFQARDIITKGRQPIELNIGGPSIVSLIHAAQLLHGLAAKVDFYACKGNDEGGAFIESKLADTPLVIGKYKTVTQYTPFTDVLSDPDFDHGNGERIFINNIGAAWQLMPSDLNDSFFESDMLVFGGTALVPHIHSALTELLLKAKTNNAITVVNTVYDFLSEKEDPTRPWALGSSVETYKSIDLLISDMEEALRLSGTTHVNDAIMFFKESGVGALIITHGSSNLHYFANNQLFGLIEYTNLPVSDMVKKEIRQYPERVGDTTGCGDNFAGGVIASIAKQQIANPKSRVSLIEAVALGVASGGFACFYNGGTYYEEFPGQKVFVSRSVLFRKNIPTRVIQSSYLFE